MPRGGARPGAGRPRKSHSEPAKAKRAVKRFAAGVAPAGEKPAEAKDWPFGVEPPEVPATDTSTTPLEFLLKVMRDSKEDPRLRMEAAKTAAPYVHGKVAEIGKKGLKQDAAKDAAAGKFRAGVAPKLVAAGGKKV
jgi:hypothetical protein